VKMGKDIKFEKNKKAKCVAVDEESFDIMSLRPKHSCTRVYNS